MSAVPRTSAFDSSRAFLSEGYDFIGNRCRTLGTDRFLTRIMLTQVLCMRGEEAARIFYDGQHFTRRGALPQHTKRLLQDLGSVQTLDGQEHRCRKGMFMAMMDPSAVTRLGDAVEAHWRQALERWAGKPSIVLHDEAREVLTRAACDWAGVSLPDWEVPLRAHELGMMIEGAGTALGKTIKGFELRRRAELWTREIVHELRSGCSPAPAKSPADRIACFHDDAGLSLDLKTAGVELLNLLRPTVAVGRFITFAAQALHEHPEWQERLRSGAPEEKRAFVQEVRRYYPFFPVVAGRVLAPFEWRGHRFRARDWVLLDLFGTNRDPALWGDPDRFRPDRFLGWTSSGFDLIPQGGGDYLADHRCPGEWITIEAMERAVTMLTSAMRYTVPPQDLTIRRDRLPTLPESGFIMADVRPV